MSLSNQLYTYILLSFDTKESFLVFDHKSVLDAYLRRETSIMYKRFSPVFPVLIIIIITIIIIIIIIRITDTSLVNECVLCIYDALCRK